jgi:hypothetical protein
MSVFTSPTSQVAESRERELGNNFKPVNRADYAEKYKDSFKQQCEQLTSATEFLDDWLTQLSTSLLSHYSDLLEEYIAIDTDDDAALERFQSKLLIDEAHIYAELETKLLELIKSSVLGLPDNQVGIIDLDLKPLIKRYVGGFKSARDGYTSAAKEGMTSLCAFFLALSSDKNSSRIKPLPSKFYF